MNPEGVITGHYYDKYASSNPLARVLMRGYRRTLRGWVAVLPVREVFEVGSGEGYVLSDVSAARPGAGLAGCDITPEVVRVARSTMPAVAWCVARGESLPFRDQSFDLVLACEVLEHVARPELVLGEIDRLTRAYVLVTVPCEPLWRGLNMARGRYWPARGNTPGHIQHWTPRGITSLVGSRFEVVKSVVVLPWIFVLASKTP